MKVVFAKHPGNGQRFLFKTAEDIKTDEMIHVDTMRGDVFAVAISPSMEIGDSSVEDFAKFHGAYLPLKEVIGRYVLQWFESKVDKPTEDKPKREVKRRGQPGEFVKVVEGCNGRYGPYKEGDIFEIIEHYYDVDFVKGSGKYNCSDIHEAGTTLLLEREYVVLEGYRPDVREVKRWAKVGEYVKVVAAQHSGGTYENGDIFLVAEVPRSDTGSILVKHKGVNGLYASEYVVLEGYTP